MGVIISRANEKLANKMGALVLQVYNDAKKVNSFSIQVAKQNCGSTNGK